MGRSIEYEATQEQRVTLGKLNPKEHTWEKITLLIVGRVATNDFKLDDISVPKGTIFSGYGVYKNKENKVSEYTLVTPDGLTRILNVKHNRNFVSNTKYMRHGVTVPPELRPFKTTLNLYLE